MWDHGLRQTSTRDSPLHKSKTGLSRGRRVLTMTAMTGTQFLQSTTLHGFKYFRDPHVLERLFWLMVHSVNICCATALCVVLWERFQQNPSILALQPPRTELSPPEPYPVVTICPPHRVSPKTADKFARKLTLPTGLDRSYITEIMPQLAVVTSPYFIYHRHEDLLMLDLVLSVNNLTYLDAITDLAPSCSELLYRCSWYGENVPCNRLFNKIVARNGVCCAFNRPIDHNLKERHLEFSSNSPEKTIMVPSTKLCVALNPVWEEKVKNPVVDCAKFKIEDISMNSRKTEYVSVLPGWEYWVETSKIQTSSTDDSDLAITNCQRNDPTKPYNHYLCQTECVVRSMLSRCGCVGPTYPLMGGQPCPPSRAPCLHSVIDEAVISNASLCACTAPCDRTRVVSKVESMELDALSFTLDPFYRDVTERMTVLRMSLRSSGSRLYILEPTVSWLTLLSSLGGVFNVFLGLGVVSVIEVLFYMTVRLPMNAFTARAISSTPSNTRDDEDE